ncbi:Asp-tRNA(Asn)/Glu-tRNA(Gln) amidotransferase A subunit family amidase [Pseudomonas sp. JUb42]|jgi:Asp-tRNA(Asn)/Glu-tRNA(Gln) amidotransferase A subunit family amidase|uniref:amidase n=1 Tax=Pseudomonas sp. JUb42 TaxID=2940611 RepID=UPI00216A6B8C|nr:amidase [Pseudomonas sp. JUb42]MCS3468236.1 Asp-tRNA(Asn)/Glu-tRNA(Gln) amidotransferase A subunit family amidase [Pseudomonas sp. JUb42]
MQTQNELVGKSAVELKKLMDSQEVSPVELLDACIARIEALNPKINAFCATSFERAREEARAVERAIMKGQPRGLLSGLPIGIKDLEETEGLLTTYGSPLFRGNVPAKDNELVRRLREAGAVVVGKTNVPEMGAGANTRNPVWGATGNPFNPRLNAGGSSGGAAAALAVDMVPLCSGSDTGGSLRIPAAKCGIVGLRTSPGLVPSERKLLGWTPISVVGPMGRTVDDTWLQLAATAGVAASDPLSYEFSMPGAVSGGVDLSTLRVGYTEDFGVCDVDDDIRQVFRNKIAALKGVFAVCEEVQIDMQHAHRCFDVVRAEAFVGSLQAAYEKDPDSLGPNPRANYEMGAQMSLKDCVWAGAEQTRIFRRFQQLFSQYDLILSPTTPVSAFPWEQPYLTHVNGVELENYYRWLALTYVVTLATNPALSMPLGVDHLGMPFGMQLIGRFRGDLELLLAARALESHCEQSADLRRPLPDLEALAASAVDLWTPVTHPPLEQAVSTSAGLSAV